MPFRPFLEPLVHFKLQSDLPRESDESLIREVKQPELNELLEKTPEEDPAAAKLYAGTCSA